MIADYGAGVGLYDEYDLNIQQAIPAKYIPAILESDRGNPYIEALPFPRPDETISRCYSDELIGYDYSAVKDMSDFEKYMHVSGLRQLRLPLPFHEALEKRLYIALTESYRARYKKEASGSLVHVCINNKECSTSAVLLGKSSNATASGFSLIGFSGSGKSSAIAKAVAHYPQVIMHQDEDGGYYPQIVYLVVNCVPNSNFSALYQGIGEAIDKAIGNDIPVYEKEIGSLNSLGKKADRIKELIDTFAVGILILDEIQLIDFAHTRENTFDSLLNLSNRTKVAMAVVGTEDARDKMFKELRTSRRVGDMIVSNIYCGSKPFFAVLVRRLFTYQWFETWVEVTPEIVDVLYDVTKGIIDQLISVYSFMHYEYFRRSPKPDVNADFIRAVTKKYFSGMQKVLADMDSLGSEERYRAAKEKQELQIQAILDNAAQRKAEKHLIDDAGKEDAVSLNNVIANIHTCFDKYTDRSIADAFNKVMAKKASKGKTEKEITSMVVEHLQNIKQIPDDPAAMYDFLSDEGGAK